MILSFVPYGFDGEFITVEADVRSGIPGMNIVGLPDTAVKESKERVRLAIKNSNYRYPDNRIVVNLAPADVKKEGASFDLAICLAILVVTNQIQWDEERPILVLGELLLSGKVRPVNSLLSALTHARKHGIKEALIPQDNWQEAKLLKIDLVRPLQHLKDLQRILDTKLEDINVVSPKPKVQPRDVGDFAAIKGQEIIKRLIAISVAGKHNLLLFGPPGSGKTYSCLTLESILQALSYKDSLNVTRIWSQAGLVNRENPLVQYPPFRTPHHSASLEGMLGGGKEISPGEISLAHKGVLFLDEAPEFPAHVLQGLREPLQNHSISIVRAGNSYHFPADFQLVMTANPCPCGNLGKEGGHCLCSKLDIKRYWKRLGGALLDRTDLRLPVSSISTEQLMGPKGRSSADLIELVNGAMQRQLQRFRKEEFCQNGRIPPSLIEQFCPLAESLQRRLTQISLEFALSSRAIHSIIKVSRTIADMDAKPDIDEDALLEAVQYRRFGDNDIFWMENV